MNYQPKVNGDELMKEFGAELSYSYDRVSRWGSEDALRA